MAPSAPLRIVGYQSVSESEADGAALVFSPILATVRAIGCILKMGLRVQPIIMVAYQ